MDGKVRVCVDPVEPYRVQGDPVLLGKGPQLPPRYDPVGPAARQKVLPHLAAFPGFPEIRDVATSGGDSLGSGKRERVHRKKGHAQSRQGQQGTVKRGHDHLTRPRLAVEKTDGRHG